MPREPKQVIVVRKDLNMRKGKIAAQVAHASMKVLLDIGHMVRWRDDLHGDLYRIEYQIPLWHTDQTPFNGQPGRDYTAAIEWLEGRFTKICVSVDSEQQLMEIYDKAKQADVLCSLVTDAGLTEFGGIPTNTCVAVGPDYPERIDPITMHLKLL